MRNIESFASFMARKRQQYGDRFQPGDLTPHLIPYFESQERIEVCRTYANGETYTRRGTVGVTTGWKPAFILMSRRSARGSSDVLSSLDVVLGIVNARGQLKGRSI